MVELRSEPYTIRTRPDVIESERELRNNLNLTQVNGVLFNAVASNNSKDPDEYDAVLWQDDKVWFIEYKDSQAAYKRMNAKRAQQLCDISRNLARVFGFAQYSFTIVVNDLEEMTVKGSVDVVPLDKLYDFKPEYSSSHIELDHLERLIEKYSRKENPAELTRDRVITELTNMKKMIVQYI